MRLSEEEYLEKSREIANRPPWERFELMHPVAQLYSRVWRTIPAEKPGLVELRHSMLTRFWAESWQDAQTKWRAKAVSPQAVRGLAEEAIEDAVTLTFY